MFDYDLQNNSDDITLVITFTCILLSCHTATVTVVCLVFRANTIITEEDLRFPLIIGEGKRARLLATIGLTRGLGDHNLKVFDSNIMIKPFLSCTPEVCMSIISHALMQYKIKVNRISLSFVNAVGESVQHR